MSSGKTVTLLISDFHQNKGKCSFISNGLKSPIGVEVWLLQTMVMSMLIEVSQMPVRWVMCMWKPNWKPIFNLFAYLSRVPA